MGSHNLSQYSVKEMEQGLNQLAAAINNPSEFKEIFHDFEKEITETLLFHDFEKVDYSSVRKIGVDETSKRRGHYYVSVFADLDDPCVLYVTDGKDAETIEEPFFS